MVNNLRLTLGLLTFAFFAFSTGYAQHEADKAATAVEQPANAAEQAPAQVNSEIQFEKDLHDFGTIEHAGNGTYEFKFTNTGTENLKIKNAKGSCGCTVPQWPREEIAPGESGVIKVTYDTKRQGGFRKTVTLTTNSTNTPVKIITITGNVKPPAPPVNVAPTEGPVNTPVNGGSH